WHACAVLDTGQAKCWGRNATGQLGDATTNDASTPVLVTGLLGATGITAADELYGDGHSCALLANGAVKCWGYNGYGELGDATTTDRHTPVLVQGL
ncbi:MAG TPA: hypothetical protein VF320_10885, partial [Acidimicrobiales bacterium]